MLQDAASPQHETGRHSVFRSKYSQNQGPVGPGNSKAATYDVLPSYRSPNKFWKAPAYRRELYRPSYPSPLYRQHSSSRHSSRDRPQWQSPKQPLDRKSEPKQSAMFRQFRYPAKAPKIPERIHRGQSRTGRVNATVSDNEMLPSYSSHQSSRILTPESLSSGSEEELLYRADEGALGTEPGPPSMPDSRDASGSEEDPEFQEVAPIPPYQAIEDEHYRSGNLSYRSTSRASVHSEASSKSLDPRPHKKSPKRKKHKSKHKKREPSSSLSPLPEEEPKEKRRHKARTPPSFKVKQPPPPSNPVFPHYLPQPIIYQMPQPYPMPIPMYPPMPQYYYPPMYPPQYPQYNQYQSPPEPPRKPAPVSRKERSTQYAAKVQTVTEMGVSPPRNNPSFVEALAEIDFRLSPHHALLSDDVKYPRPVALEIGIGESKSLAEHFQEKLPEVSAKMTTRNSERSRREHKEKSVTQLLEIRREMLRVHTPRVSISHGSSVERKDSPSLRKINPIQLEKIDRLAAGRPSIVTKKSSAESTSASGISIVVKKETVETVVVAPPAVVPAVEVKAPEPPKPPANINNDTFGKEAQTIAEIRIKTVEEEKKEERKETAASKKSGRVSRAPVKIQ